MRVTRLFGKTLRQDPSEAETTSHRLLLKAGMVNSLASGIYSYLPLGWRVLRKIETIIREEMDAEGAAEIMMPALHPIEIWQETGRDEAFGENLFTLKDRRGRVLCLGPTHEEVVTDLVRQHVSSYRDLPLTLYQIQTKFRDEVRPRGGLLRVREFDMKDAYSFDVDEDGLGRSYDAMVNAYKRIFSRCGLSPLQVEADSGAIGGKDSNEFIQVSDSGEDVVLSCTSCGYAANLEKARFAPSPSAGSEIKPLEKVFTPGTSTIKALSKFLERPECQLLKAVVYWAKYSKGTDSGRSEGLLMVFIPGDREVNEIKLRNVLEISELRTATDEEVKAAGIPQPGFIGPCYSDGTPLKLKPGVASVVDELVPTAGRWVTGANEVDHHNMNVNYPRDFGHSVLSDVALAREGDLCVSCGNVLAQVKGIEVGHVFKLGTFFTDKLEAKYLDNEGTQRSIIMGCYGIGVGRLLAASVECNNDEKGIIFPPSIAPFQIYLCALNIENSLVQNEAEKVYGNLQKEGLEVLFDDRIGSAGVKFNDADLLGIPVRLTVSPRTLEKGSVELKGRTEQDAQLVKLGDVTAAVLDALLGE